MTTATAAAPAPLLCDEPVLPGLLWAMRFDESGRGHLVERGETLPAPGSFGEGFTWLHFNLNDARLPALFAEGRLGPPHLTTAAFASDPHQRLMVEAGHIGGVVADLVCETGESPKVDAGGRLHFIMGPRLLVSGRRHPVLGPDRARDAAAEGRGILAPIQLLDVIVEQVVTSMAETGARLVDELDEIEDHILDERVRGERRRLGPIRRDAVRRHRQLLGLRAVFHRLETAAVDEQVPAAAVTAAARIAQRLDALDRDMVLLADRSRLMQEELSSYLAQASNRQLYTLSVLTALFLPPTLVTGLFGMNTKSLPLTENDGGSYVAMAIAGLSALVAFFLIRGLGIRPPRD
ncbi:CorA family divalent cation transporter [Methylobacterium brachiatum]|uniref:CorA family divalent cation transporter n=1 Tax=Methylobacterium brachiatum TaxID=269660 RepID=UPI002446C28E|nr:CorA family divalent cation transporter [Methylobacterium brachiatum]MDH2312347.1 CorA family divalent cation transporter [Methylobacterium brachiatum]